MLETIAALQLPLIGAVLIWSASVKLFTRRGKVKAQNLALSKLVGKERAPLAYRTVGGGEALLGLALIAPPVWPIEAFAAVALALGFVGYLTYARIAAPESSCGCMGAANVPINWRAFARAGWMLGTALLAIPAVAGWWTVVVDTPLTSLGILAAEAALFVAVSPEFDGVWLVPLRRLKIRFTNPLGGGEQTSAIPLATSVERLQHSDLYRYVSSLLKSDVREYWDEGEYRVICYVARVHERTCTAVWAVPLYENISDDSIRVAFVDDETDEIVLRLDGPPDANEPRPDWALPVPAA